MIVRDIKGYEGLYSINEDGGVWSYRTQKFLTPRPDKDGYLRVGLTKDRHQRTFFIHRLLAETFIPNPNNLPLVNHKNEIKTDNRLENLEWATQWYNLEYSRNRERALRHGNAYETKKEAKTMGRNSSGISKPVRCIETGEIFSSGKEAAETMGLDPSHISKVCRGKAKTTGGYHFEFVQKEAVINED